MKITSEKQKKHLDKITSINRSRNRFGIPRKDASAYMKAWRVANPEKVKEITKRQWINRDKEKRKEWERNYYHKIKNTEKFKSSKTKRITYQRLWTLRKKEQFAGRQRPNKCEICNEYRKIVFDHNHDTGQFRGWICDKCNVAIGMIDENIDKLLKIKNYLEERNGK